MSAPREKSALRQKVVSLAAMRACVQPMFARQPAAPPRPPLKLRPPPAVAWFGRCPSFRPLTEADTNRKTKL
jgi:hypothetical protein